MPGHALAFFGPSQTWQMATAGRVVEHRRVVAADRFADMWQRRRIAVRLAHGVGDRCNHLGFHQVVDELMGIVGMRRIHGNLDQVRPERRTSLYPIPVVPQRYGIACSLPGSWIVTSCMSCGSRFPRFRSFERSSFLSAPPAMSFPVAEPEVTTTS